MMLRLVLAVLLGLAGVALLAKGRVAAGTSGDKPRTFPVWGVGVVLLGVAGLILLSAAFYKVDTGEGVVVKSFGTIKRSQVNPGLHVKAPWETLVRYDIRNQTISFHPGEDADDVAITAATLDNATATIDVTVRYSLEPGSLEKITRTFGSQENLRLRAILPGARSALQNAPATFNAAVLRQSRPELISKVRADLEARLGDNGVRIDEVDPRTIQFDAEVEKSLNQVQQARAKVESARANLDTAKINADVVKTEAKAQSDADQIIRCGATTSPVTDIVNGKPVDTIAVTPIPNDQCQNRLNEQVLTSKYIDMLRARTGDTTYVLPPDVNSLLNLSKKNNQ